MEKYYVPYEPETFKQLALLYLQSKNLKGLSPEEIFDMYNTAYNRIAERCNLTYTT